MERVGRLRRFAFARVGLDRDFLGRHVEVHAPVLDFLLFVDLPAALSRDAEAGVVEDEDEFAVWLEE